MAKATMNNLENWLSGIDLDDEVLNLIIKQLKLKYSFDLIRNILSLPCLEYEAEKKLSLLIALIEDKEVNDTIVDLLCNLLQDISNELWGKYCQELVKIIENIYYTFSRSQLLLLANTIEIMYAKGDESSFHLAHLIYQRIPLNDKEFNPDSDDNVRIKLAKIAYSTHEYNINGNLVAIHNIKKHLEKSGRKYLFGTINYYRGICMGAVGYKADCKDAMYYILKSKEKGFSLASIYLSNSRINSETSSEHKKARQSLAF